MVTGFVLLLLALLLLSFSAGYLMGLERSRARARARRRPSSSATPAQLERDAGRSRPSPPRRHGGSGPPAVSRGSSQATTHPTALTERIGAYCSSVGSHGGLSAVVATRLAHPEPNSYSGGTSSIGYRGGERGLEQPPAAGSHE